MSTEQPYAERARVYAETLAKRFQSGILKSMQDKPLWSLYRLDEDVQGNVHKRPYTPKGYPASMQKPANWSHLDSALEALATGTFAGIGIMLPTPYILIDKDATEAAPIYDKEERKIVSPFAMRLLQQVPSYAELSPNNGLHIITEGMPRRGNFKKPELEMYTNWFSTVTTRHLPGTPLDITNQQAALEALEDEFHPSVPEIIHNTGGDLRGSARLAELPPEAANDQVLQDLLAGDMSRYGNDHHRADWHLLMKLLHWTGDDRQLVRSIFLNSPLGQREKARESEREGRRGRTNYLDRTIERIIANRRNPPQRR